MKKLNRMLLLPLLVIFLAAGGAWTTPTESADERYADAPILSAYANETVSYTNKVVAEKNVTAGEAPKYVAISGLANACGAVAGAEIVAYYDKYYSEMIPDWVSYYTGSGKYRKQDSTYVPALMRQLYTLMRTNVDDAGVSQADFKNGLQSYVNGKGYSISYQSVLSGGSVNYSACKSAIGGNKVIVLFANAGNIYSLVSGSGYDTITPFYIDGAHIFVAFGYRKIQYYNANGIFRTDIYLDVVTGLSSPTTALYKIDSNNLNAAYIVNIN